MEKMPKMNEDFIMQDDIGFMLWKLESVEDFFPCYKTLIEKKE